MLTTEGSKSPYREAYRVAAEVRTSLSQILAISSIILQPAIPIHRLCFPVGERLPVASLRIRKAKVNDVSRYFRGVPISQGLKACPLAYQIFSYGKNRRRGEYGFCPSKYPWFNASCATQSRDTPFVYVFALAIRIPCHVVVFVICVARQRNVPTVCIAQYGHKPFILIITLKFTISTTFFVFSAQ
jgi:hypothetical protein